MDIEIKNQADLIKVQAYLLEILSDINSGKVFDISIKQHREKRSKNANDYSWVLQDKIAKATDKGVDEIHRQMVLDYGVIETYSILKEAVPSAIRLFDYYKKLGESEVNGKTFVHIRAGVGTHLYDTAEMSHFINGIIQEAQQLGIQTKTPAQVAELLNLWEQGKR